MLLIGKRYEKIAAKTLKKSGLSIQEFNYRCKHGEIDIIAKDKNQLVFVEVKYRTSEQYGTASEHVTAAKMRKLRATASHYLQKYRLNDACRFDVVAINGQADNIEWIKNAF